MSKLKHIKSVVIVTNKKKSRILTNIGRNKITSMGALDIFNAI